MNDVFLDTGFAIALACPRDQHHQFACDLADKIQSQSTTFITTRAVVMEIGNALSKQQYRQAASRLLTSLESDARVEIVPLEHDLFVESLDLFSNRADKNWSLTDCMSFVVMEKRGLREALTPDEHFIQAGYRALMRTEE